MSKKRPGELPLWHSDALRSLAGYRVERVVSEHGEMCIFDGTDQRTDRPVTLTVLDPRFTDHKRQQTEFVERARPALGIQHPNIIGLKAAERCSSSGLLVIASEPVPTESLGRLLWGQSLDQDDALAICQAVVEGMAYLGQKRIPHGAIRPSCIYLDSECMTPRLGEVGQPWIAGPDIERKHCVAPEQAAGGGAPSHPADIYSVGVVLYRCLTGRYPFEGATAEELEERRAQFDVPDPREVEPKVSTDVAKLVGWMCERKPRARYQSAHTVNLDVLRVMAGETPKGPRGAKLKSPDLLLELLRKIDARIVDPVRPRGLWGKGSAYSFRVRVSSRGTDVDTQTFNTEALTVGRSPECELRVDNPIVSRKHLQIRRIGTHFVFKTLSATNTTALGERAVEGEAWFMPGMPIELAGKFTLVFEWAPGALQEVVRRQAPNPAAWLNEPTKRFKVGAGAAPPPGVVRQLPFLTYMHLGTEKKAHLELPFQVGHSPSCDLRLPNDQPFKAAIIIPGQDGHRVYNLTNDPGLVRVNGEYVQDRALLNSGDVVTVADETVQLTLE